MLYPLLGGQKMEITIVKAEEDGQMKEDSLQSMSKDKELADDSSLSKRMVKKVKPKGLLVLNVMHSQSGKSCIQESFLRRICILDSRIPKHIVNLDEKYLRHCLELIYVSASKAASCNIPENSGSSNIGILSDSWSSLKIRSTYACDLAKFVVGCPLEAGTGNVVISPAGEWIVGSISRSKSILNILKSPLLQQSGAKECDIKSGRADLIDATKSVGSDLVSSPGWLSIDSSQKLEKKMVVLGSDSYGSEPVHKRLVSLSSTNATISDESSSSIFAGVTQGMLQCSWEAGFPHYVFSVDDQKEVYVANLFKTESPDDKVLNYTYMFHSRAGGEKENEIHENDSALVGKMRVSTTFTLCPNNSETVETEFVLFGSDETSLGEMQTSSHTLKKNKGLSKKMVEVFKTSEPSKQRTSAKYGGIGAILENSSWKPWPDSCTNPNPLGTTNLSENLLPPNLELAAIIVKDHIHGCHQEEEIGGWGLKFLKKAETKQAIASLEATPSGCCLRNTGDCSTSVDILVPACFHGGPRNRNGGPSSLTERWRSGGRCDCGGWDVGCPLTIINTRPSMKEVSPQADTQGHYKSFDLFTQGSVQDAPVMKVVNIHDGLYFIHFQSTLSALQSFSIAAAIIHTQSPTLQSKCTGVEVASTRRFM